MTCGSGGEGGGNGESGGGGCGGVDGVSRGGGGVRFGSLLTVTLEFVTSLLFVGKCRLFIARV